MELKYLKRELKDTKAVLHDACALLGVIRKQIEMAIEKTDRLETAINQEESNGSEKGIEKERDR